MDFRETRVCKSLSAVILFFFVWTFAGGYDIAMAAKTGDLLSPPSAAPGLKEPSPAAKLNAAMAQAEAVLADSSLTMKEKQSRLKDIKDAIRAIDVEMRAGFDKTGKHLKDKKLPLEIMSRHKKFVRHYDSNYGQLMKDLNDLERAKKQEEFDRHAGRALGHLKEAKPKKRHQPLDPNKLPHRSAEPTDKKPRLKKEEFIDELRAQGEPVLLASAGPIAGLLDANTDYQMLALASGAPTDADLAETIEVQFTEAIVAKAAELNNDPLTIYEWVRNNVEFAPTWGSIQGADYCLQTMECNAMDTASLLIALLRASGVHARYAHGTIEMPIEKAKNWLGGFTDSYAALKFSQSGGIPSKGLVDGGAIRFAQFEHVWVEAWIDYFPSRGAKHQNGQGDTWIPLDASFKQYEYTQGMDLAEAVPFDAETFVDDLVASATINEEQGYVTGVDSAYIQQAMESYQTQVSDYMAANHPDATFGDLLGMKQIAKQEFPYLLGTLPYRLKVVGARYADLPSGLRHSITFKVGAQDSLSFDELSYSASLPELGGKKVTLSYAPATQADEDLINSILPEPNPDGTPLDPSQLPTELPVYMISLKPQLMVEGTVEAEGGAVTMGTYQNMKMIFSLPTLPGETITNMVASGEYFGVALDLGRISLDQVNKIKTRLESTKATLESGDYEGVKKEDLIGDILYTTAMSYYVEADVTDYMQAKALGVAMVRLPSEAVFSSMLDVEEFYGSPVSASVSGLFMDVDRAMSANIALDGNAEKVKQYMINSGTNGSALEHGTPELLFSTTENPGEGVSAVKALQIANSQGVPIYMVTKDNISSILPQLSLDAGVITDIQNAVNSGKEVTVSKSNISYNGWTGCGYIVMDPVTGAAGYMISEGLAGTFMVQMGTYSFMLGLLVFFIADTVGPLSAAAAPYVAASIAIMIASIGAIAWGLDILTSVDSALSEKICNHLKFAIWAIGGLNNLKKTPYTAALNAALVYITGLLLVDDYMNDKGVCPY